ncbi:MAG: hypothetical protein DWQ31_19545 [Planctomycetota bacterium]|nr:MAG: hypothetical protein DWQ31_19545 [Planctomycetota bacterium]REJ93300.1 MAG: hypothetical protein DWQ35_10710 [Planctomycetota bacterium]
MSRSPHGLRVFCLLVGLLLAANSTEATLQFNFTPVGNLADMQAGNQGPAQQTLALDVIGAFGDAGDLWSAIFDDDITINVDIDFDNLGAGILGSTGNVTAQSNFAPTKTALINDVTSADDAMAVANFQPGTSLDMLTNDNSTTASPVIRDNDGSANNFALDVPRANLKALGILAGNDPASDGSISFSNLFSWDFDQTPSGGEFDLIGVAAHEIGHLMGFVSGVDVVDITGGVGPFAPTALDNFRVFSVLDLYRYSAASLAEPSQPATGAVLDLAFGGNPFFSIDGGATSLATFSTGSFNGIGRQASHWLDNLGQGIMDPTFGAGEVGVITALDIQAFDVIGYDLIPAPTCLVGDADCDGDVDISGDILPALSNFTGPGSFGKTRLEGDVQGDLVGTPTTNVPADGDVDVSDLLIMLSSFTGPLDEGGLGDPAEAGDPNIPDLIYNAATGEVILDPDGSSIIGYSLQNATNSFLPAGHTPILVGVTTSLTSQLEEAALAPGSGSIGLVFPTGLDLAGLQALLAVNQVSRSLGAPLVPFDLVVLGTPVPEPATWAMAALALVLLPLARAVRRRSPAGQFGQVRRSPSTATADR